MPVMTAAAMRWTDDQARAVNGWAPSTSLLHRQVVQARVVVGVRRGGERGDRPPLRGGFGHGAALAFRLRRAGRRRGWTDREGARRKPSLPRARSKRCCGSRIRRSGSTVSSIGAQGLWPDGRDRQGRRGRDSGRDDYLKPWKVETFKVSNDPRFEEKLSTSSGCTESTRARGGVLLRRDAQRQALDRTQPSRPMKPGRGGTMTHDYKRNGTIDLFAAMNVADWRSPHRPAQRTRRSGCSEVLQTDRRRGPARSRRTRHPRQPLGAFHTRDRQMVGAQGPPPLAPALHADLQLMVKPRRTVVQGLTDKRLRRGTFASIAELTEAITTWATHWNLDPKAIHLESHRRRHHRQGPTRTRHPPPNQIADRPLATVFHSVE